MRVLIVGAGIGGLTAGLGLSKAGHEVTIFEQATKLSEAGAGIQLAPNATRVLRRFGILSEVIAHANQPSGTIIRRYSDDSEIGPRSHSGSLQNRFDAPMLVIHRADLQRILMKAAVSSGSTLLTGSCVEDIDLSFDAGLTLSSGQRFTGDLIIAADGINSRTRALMAEHWAIKDQVTSTGDSAYRVTIPRDRLVDCPEILEALDAGLSTRWIGPQGHIMAYPIRNGTYNVVMVHPNHNDSTDETSLWTKKGSVDKLWSFYKNWSPAVHHIAKHIESAALMEWPLNKRPNLPAWHINRICLLGDAAHPMLPYVAQGAAQAIEDAAVLTVCLTSLTETDKVLHLYEKLRKRRAEFIQGSAAEMRRVLHLIDGSEQEKRDEVLRAPRTTGYKHPDLWADPQFQQDVWGHDILAEAERACHDMTSNSRRATQKIESVL